MAIEKHFLGDTYSGFPGSAVVKNLPDNAGTAKTQVQSLDQDDPLE